MKELKVVMIVMLISIFIAGAWDKLPIIKNSISYLLNPTFGVLLKWNLFWGLLILIILVNFILTIVHKHTTDQKGLKELRDEGKKMQDKMKEYKDQPDKMMELQKQQMAMFPKNFSLSMKSIAYTSVPLILSFRWFSDFFISLGNPKIFLGLGWFGNYLIFSLIFTSIMRKLLKVY